jgi:hypothetical protein
MTERLSTLLHDEASGLDVPAPAAPTVLVRGRSLRRRRRITTGVAAAAVVALLGGSVAVALNAAGHDRAEDLQPARTPDLGAVFSVGTTVYLDSGERRATIDDGAVKSMYYTSVGILVRHGNNPYSDGGGPQRFSLVRPDGTVSRVDVETEETVHSTDPDQPYLAYAEVVDGTVNVVVWDVDTNEEQARVPVPGKFTWGGWPAPPVALSGDTVYVGFEDVARAVDWRTGEITETDTIAPGYPDVSGGRSLDNGHNALTVQEVASGDVVLEVEAQDVSANLSPDGRYLLVAPYFGPSPPEVYSVDSGQKVALDKAGRVANGWTPDDELFGLDKGKLTVCSPTTGECTTSEVDVDGGTGRFAEEIKLGGVTYES